MLTSHQLVNNDVSQLILSFLSDLKIIYRNRGLPLSMDEERQFLTLKSMYSPHIKNKSQDIFAQNNLARTNKKIGAHKYKQCESDQDEEPGNLFKQQWGQKRQKNINVKNNNDENRKYHEADVEMERNLAKWAGQQLQQDKYLQNAQIKREGRRLSNRSNFKGSNGWLKGFLGRYPDLNNKIQNHNKNYESKYKNGIATLLQFVKKSGKQKNQN